jgi:O-antigen ligase
MGLAVPFSTWMGGSLLHWIGYVRVNFPMLLVVSGLATTWNDCKKVFYVIGFASLINLATARLFMQAASTDRLAMEFAGAISNSNDLAAHLLLVLPILLFVVLKPRSPFIVRAIGLTAFVVGLYVILSTGSRGALIALVVTCMYVFFTGTSRQKLTIAVAGPLGLLVLIAFLPGSTWNRLMSFSENGKSTGEAIESSEAREYLLKKSIVFTFQRPIFGVGPGQFSMYEGSTMSSQGLRGNWHETHNTYTQVSSENGIPALVFFLGAIVSTFSILRQIRKRAVLAKNQEMITAVFCLMVGLVAYCAACTFINFAYKFYLLTISSLVMAMWAAVSRELPVTASATDSGKMGTYLNASTSRLRLRGDRSGPGLQSTRPRLP